VNFYVPTKSRNLTLRNFKVSMESRNLSRNFRL
jgi:hypothetical protein